MLDKSHGKQENIAKKCSSALTQAIMQSIMTKKSSRDLRGSDETFAFGASNIARIRILD